MTDFEKYSYIFNTRPGNAGKIMHGDLSTQYRNKINSTQQKDLAVFTSKKDFFSFCEKLQQELLEKTIAEENLIAQGSQGKFYRIPGTNCALRVPNDCMTVPIKPINKNVSSQDKANYILGRIGDNIEIIKYIDGKSVKELKKRGMSIKKIILNMPQEAYAGYIEKIKNAAQANMFHNYTKENTLINEKYRFIVPIDFAHSLTKKANPIEDLYFQFGNYLTTKEEQNNFFAKSVLGLVSLIEQDKLNYHCAGKINVSPEKILEKFNPEDKKFICDSLSKLKKLLALKKLENISPDAKRALPEEIQKYKDYINSHIKN